MFSLEGPYFERNFQKSGSEARSTYLIWESVYLPYLGERLKVKAHLSQSLGTPPRLKDRHGVP